MSKTIVIRVNLYGKELKSYAFDQDVVRIGREPDCDICLPPRGVSRLHAQIRRETDGFRITDAGSSNGTQVNGVKVNECLLQSGDSILILNFTLTVELHSAGSAPLMSTALPQEHEDFMTIRKSEIGSEPRNGQ